MSRGTFTIGKLTYGPAQGNLKIRYGAKGEFKKVKADGKNNARQTWLGYENAQIKLSGTCKDDNGDGVVDGPINNYMRDFLKQVGVRSASGGKAWAWTEDDQEVFNVHDVTVEETSLERTPGTGTFTWEILLASWVKPAPSPIVTSTPKIAKPWSPSGKAAPPAPPKPGFANTPPVVKP